MEEKKSNKKIIFCVIIVLLIIILVGVGIIIYIKQKEAYENDTTKPVIYVRNENEIVETPIFEEKSFSNNIVISWTDSCKGIIQKEGEEISQEDNTTLKKEGTYEITVTSPTGKMQETQTVIIDKTEPKAEMKKNASGSYTITFEEVEDVEKATLKKLDVETGKIMMETDLVKNGLIKPVIEIKEKGYYILELEDKLGNSSRDKIKFKVE